MVGHVLIEIASVAMIIMTSISPEMYQTMLNMWCSQDFGVKYELNKEKIIIQPLVDI